MSFAFLAHTPSKPDLDTTDLLGSLCFASAVFLSALVVDSLSRRRGRAFLTSPAGLAVAAGLLLAGVVCHLAFHLDEYAATALALVLCHPYLYVFTGAVAVGAYIAWNMWPFT